MKRFISLFISLLITVTLAGCHSSASDTVSFYYCQDPQQHQYFDSDSIIQAEHRDLMGHQGDIKYMVGLYLAGPIDEGMAVPFTKSTKLLSAQLSDRKVLIELSDHTRSLTDSEFSLSCAALAMTCMDFIDCTNVTIISANRSITMNADSILLSDALPTQETNGG